MQKDLRIKTTNGSHLEAHTMKKTDLYAVDFIKEPVSPKVYHDSAMDI